MAQQPPFPEYQPQSNSSKQRRGPVILLVVLLLVLVAVLVTGAVILLRGDDKPKAVDEKPKAPQAVEFHPVLKVAPGTCPSPAAAGVYCEKKTGMRYTLGKVELNGSHVSEVTTAMEDGGAGGWYVRLTLDEEGKRAFSQLTTELAGKQPPANQMAIVVGAEVVTAPTVNSPITAGQVQIAGSYTKDEADALAAEITG